MEAAVQQPSKDPEGQEFHPTGNGANGNGALDAASPEFLALILQSLQTMKDGNFSVRLPVSWTGLPGKIADSFNEIVTANEQMALELKRVGAAAPGTRWKSRSTPWLRTCCGPPRKLRTPSPLSPRAT
jgi:hypothetical protein